MQSTELEPQTSSWLRRLIMLFTLAYWREWFARPCGGWEAIRLATPIVISSGSIALMNFADRVYLTWFSTDGMSAAFQSGCLLWFFITFPNGIATFVNTFVAQYYGAKQYDRIGSVVWQGVLIGMVSGVVFVAATPLVAPFFQLLGATPDVALMEREYWFYFALGVAATVGHEPFAAFFCGRRDMKTVMVVGIAAVLLNIVLDPIFIFGIKGHMRMGVGGAALASAISLWAKFFIYVYLTLKEDASGKYRIRQDCGFRWKEMKRLLRFGMMSSVQVMTENGFFTLFVLLMGYLGTEVSAASAIAFNLNFLVFMPIFGVGLATTTMVGNQIGAGQPKLARRAALTSGALAVAFSGLFMVAFLLAPNFFLDFYALKNPEEFQSIRPLAVVTLRFMALYLFGDTINTVFTAALRGAGDTRFIMIATGLIAPPILVAIFGGVLLCGRGLYWSWGFLTGYLFLNGSVFLIRFARGKWQKNRLIEVNLVEAA